MSGHKARLRPQRFTMNKPVVLCKVCHPNGMWFRFKLKGKHFQTRSRVEQAFTKFLISKGIDVKRIEYEPKGSRVGYHNPVKKKDTWYTPDFKVGNVRFEVKDLASLGLQNYHWQTKEEALIENRAKYEAAVAEFDDYRVYVFIKGNFYRTREFWTAKEQKRLQHI